VQLGLGSSAAGQLRELIESTPQPERARRRVSVPPGVAVEVDFHGAPGGALRDAVLRRVDRDAVSTPEADPGRAFGKHSAASPCPPRVPVTR
jgi:hypothetical protein